MQNMSVTPSSSTNLDYSETDRENQKIRFYKLGRILGFGNFATVRVAFHEVANSKVAVKIVDKHKLNPENLAMVEREIQILQKIRHPYVIRLFEVIRTEDQKIYIVTEYVNNGELFELLIALGKQTENESRRLFRQIVCAVAYLHNSGIVHRDIKAENILLDKRGNIKLIDFGFSSCLTSGLLFYDFCGSPPYAAPELLLAREYDGRQSDIWSLGVILYILVTGGFPFPGDSVEKLKIAFLAGDRSLKIPFWVSVECANLIRKMLTIAPSKRINMPGIVNSKWFMAQSMDPKLKDLFDQVNIPIKNWESKKSLNEETSLYSNAIDPIILKHTQMILKQMGTNWSEQQIAEEITSKNYESPIFATYEIIASRLASTLNSSQLKQIHINSDRTIRRGSILTGKANDLDIPTTVIPLHHLAKLQLNSGDEESDESDSDNSEQNVSTNSQNFTGHHPHHERRQNQNNRFAEEKAKTEATKLVPAINAFPFYANPFLNASTQFALARTAALFHQQLTPADMLSKKSDLPIHHFPLVNYIRANPSMNEIQMNLENRRASANEALFGYAQHLCWSSSIVAATGTGSRRNNSICAGSGERCVSSLAGTSIASPTSPINSNQATNSCRQSSSPIQGQRVHPLQARACCPYFVRGGERRKSWASTTSTTQQQQRTASSNVLNISPQQHAQLEFLYKKSMLSSTSNNSINVVNNDASANLQPLNFKNLQQEFQLLCAQNNMNSPTTITPSISITPASLSMESNFRQCSRFISTNLSLDELLQRINVYAQQEQFQLQHQTIADACICIRIAVPIFGKEFSTNEPNTAKFLLLELLLKSNNEEKKVQVHLSTVDDSETLDDAMRSSYMKIHDALFNLLSGS